MAKPTGAVARVTEALIRGIVSRRYPPGLRLPTEVELAAEFGCGRSTVREALRYVTGLGLLKTRRGSGAVVRDFLEEGCLELLPYYYLQGDFEHPIVSIVTETLNLRKLLACEAVRLASLYGTKERLAAVRERIVETERLSDDPLAHSLSELEVFRALAHASGMMPAAWLANSFTAAMADVNQMVAVPLRAVQRDWLEVMEALLELVEAGETEGAVEHLRRYLERVDRELTDGLQSLFSS